MVFLSAADTRLPGQECGIIARQGAELMSRASTIVLGLVVVSLVSVAGCPPVDPGTPPATITISGTWSGTLSCTSTQTLSGSPTITQSSQRSFTITFNAEGVPTSLPVWGFTNAPDQSATISAVGESQTFNFTAADRDTTITVTITEATYTGSSARVVMSLQYSATGGALTQQGTGTVTITATVSGDALTFNAVADYDVTQTAGSISFESGETTECAGPLTRT